MKVKVLVLLVGSYFPTAFAAQNIETCEQLLDIPNRTTETYILTQDVDCNGFMQNKAVDFKGYLDGNGYSIIGLEIRYDDSNMGLFSRIIGGSVTNLGLDSMVITDNYRSTSIGLLAGNVAYDTKISSIEINDSSIRTTQPVSYGLGLLVGYASDESKLEIIRSYNSQIDATDKAKHVGGLIGVLSESSFRSSSIDRNKINVSYDLGGNVSLGGVIGTLEESVVSDATIENSTIMAGSLERGYGAMFIGKMNKSRLVNGLSTNNEMEHSGVNGLFKPAIAVGYIYDEFGLIPTLENIRTSSLINLHWYNRGSVVLTKKLQIIE